MSSGQDKCLCQEHFASFRRKAAIHLVLLTVCASWPEPAKITLYVGSYYTNPDTFSLVPET